MVCDRFLIRRVALISISPMLNIYSAVMAQIVPKFISMPILIESDNKEKSVKTLGFIDSGAEGEFIDQNYARQIGLEIQKLDKPLLALNVDGTKNK